MAHVTLLEILKAWVQVVWENRPEILKKPWWVIDFNDTPYHDQCFVCNLGGEECPKCPFRGFVKPEDKIPGM